MPRRLLTALGGCRIRLQFLPQLRHLLLRLGQRLLQGGLAAKRSRPGTGANFHPVLCHAVQAHQSFGHQAGHALGQQTIQQFDVLRAKVGKGVIVHRHAAANPPIRRMVLAQSVQFSGTAHAAERRVQPQRQQDARVGGRLSRTALDRLNCRPQLRQVQAADVVPHDPSFVFLREQLVERAFLKLDLIPHGVPQSFWPDPRRQSFGRLGFLPRPPLKQRPLIHCPSSELPGHTGIKPLEDEIVFLFSQKIHSL